MKLEKKHWIIIGVVLALIAIWYFFLRKKKVESGYAGTYGSFGNESGYVDPRKGTTWQYPPMGAASKISCPKGWSMMGGKCQPDGALSSDKIKPPYSPMNPNPKGSNYVSKNDPGGPTSIGSKPPIKL